MNKLFTFILGLFLVGTNIQGTYAQLSPYDQNRPVGFGANTTGGEGGKNITVTTASELADALEMDGKYTIYIKGEIKVNELIKAQVQDKTILGLPGSALTNPNRTQSGSGILYFRPGSDNVILRNVTFKSAGAYDVDGSDNFCLDQSTNIWVDHCDFQDGVDGNFDCKSASDNVAVTWCLFQYKIEPEAGGSGGSDDHRFSNLWGSSDDATGDRDHLNTTFQFCHWDNCKGRMPRVRFGKVDVVNCYYTPVKGATSVQCGNESSLSIRNCVFEGDQKPWGDYTESSEFSVVEEGSIFDGCTRPSDMGTGDKFTPSYSLTVVPADEVIAAVTGERGAGATLNVVENEGVITEGGETPEPEPEPEPTPEPTETRTWDFTNWSAETIANMTADAANWTVKSETRFANAVNMSGTLMANGVTVAETEGLLFEFGGTDKCRINHSSDDNNLQINGGNKYTITISGCKAGDIVTIDFNTGSSSTPRGVTVTNTTPAESSLVTERAQESFTVSADGNVVIAPTAGLLFYTISVATQGGTPDPDPEPEPEPEPEPTESRAWDFTTWGTETLDNLAADATNWAFETGKDRYNNVTEMSGTLKANNVAIAETNGLLFDNLKAGKIRIDYGSGRLQLNGSNLTVTVPGCKEGSTVTIDFVSANATNARGWNVTNATVSAGELITGRTQQSFTVAADGDITFSTTGGLNLYSITYKAPESVGISQAAGEDEVIRTEYFSISGMRLNEPQQGLNIVRTIYKSGKTETAKAYIR